MILHIHIIYILLCGILVQHLPQLKDRAKEVIWNIPSKFTDEMSKKSDNCCVLWL